MVRKVTAMKVRDSLGRLLDEVHYRGDEVVIERAGRAMAVLVPMERYEQYRKSRQERFQALDRIKTKARRVPAKQLDEIIDEADSCDRHQRTPLRSNRTRGYRVMRMLDVTKATGSLADYAREIKKGPALLTRRGKPVAALVSVRNADAETLALSTSPLFMALIDRSRSRLKSEGSLSQGEIRRRLKIKHTGRSR